jgi:hypothetical protein
MTSLVAERDRRADGRHGDDDIIHRMTPEYIRVLD